VNPRTLDWSNPPVTTQRYDGTRPQADD